MILLTDTRFPFQKKTMFSFQERVPGNKPFSTFQPMVFSPRTGQFGKDPFITTQLSLGKINLILPRNSIRTTSTTLDTFRKFDEMNQAFNKRMEVQFKQTNARKQQFGNRVILKFDPKKFKEEYGFDAQIVAQITKEEVGGLSGEELGKFLTEKLSGAFETAKQWVSKHRTEIADTAQTVIKVGVYLGALSLLAKENPTLFAKAQTHVQAIALASGVSVVMTAARQNVEVIKEIAPLNEDGTRGSTSKAVSAALALTSTVVTGDIFSGVIGAGLSFYNNVDQENKTVAVAQSVDMVLKTVTEVIGGEESVTQVTEEVTKAVATGVATGIVADIMTSPKGPLARAKEWLTWLIFQPYTDMKKATTFKAKLLHGVDLTIRILLATTLCLAVIKLVMSIFASWALLVNMPVMTVQTAQSMILPIQLASAKLYTLGMALLI